MTLTAVTKNGTLINPSIMISTGRDELEVVFEVRNLNDNLFCPHCLRRTGEYFPVKFRNAQSRAKHFYHLRQFDQAQECQHFSTESEKHIAAITAIADSLAATEPDEIRIDTFTMASEGVTRRKPDIWVRRGQAIEVYEVQVSPISLEDFQQRVQDARKHGAIGVTWYLYGGNFNNLSIRLWAKQNRVTIYHLWFEDGDASIPRWKVDDGVGLERSQKASASDNCSTQSSDRHSAPETTAKPKGNITHIRKPGWVGVIWEKPWGGEKILDVQWVEAPEGKTVPLFPSRYPIADLLCNGEPIA